MIDSFPGGVRIRLLIQPKASKNEVLGPHNGEIRIRLTSPPVDGKANESLIGFLSDLFRVPKRDITIVRGATSRHKMVEIAGVDENQVEAILVP